MAFDCPSHLRPLSITSSLSALCIPNDTVVHLLYLHAITKTTNFSYQPTRIQLLFRLHINTLVCSVILRINDIMCTSSSTSMTVIRVVTMRSNVFACVHVHMYIYTSANALNRHQSNTENTHLLKANIILISQQNPNTKEGHPYDTYNRHRYTLYPNTPPTRQETHHTTIQKKRINMHFL